MGELFKEEDVGFGGDEEAIGALDNLEAEAHANALLAEPATEPTPQNMKLASALQHLALNDGPSEGLEKVEPVKDTRSTASETT